MFFFSLTIFIEKAVIKNRPQPQVLVPLRGPPTSGFASQPSKMQQVQQKASLLTASVKGGQAFISSTCQRKPEIQNAHSPSTQAIENLQPAPLQNGKDLLAIVDEIYKGH